MRKHISSARLRQAILVWTTVLSLVLVWAGAQPRLADFARHATPVGFAALQAPDHAATLTTVGKSHRAPEYRHGSDPDLAALASGATYGPFWPDLAAEPSGTNQPGGNTCCTVPEARAPPRI